MSKLFHVSLDDLLNDENTQIDDMQKPKIHTNQTGIHVNREMVDGFHLY